jgi:hypothetical protein
MHAVVSANAQQLAENGMHCSAAADWTAPSSLTCSLLGYSRTRWYCVRACSTTHKHCIVAAREVSGMEGSASRAGHKHAQ